MFETIGRVEFVEERRRDDAKGRQVGYLLPKDLQQILSGLSSTGRQAIGDEHSIYGTGAGGAYAVEIEALVIEQTIQHSPSEGTMASSALEGQIDRLLPGERHVRGQLGGLGTNRHGANSRSLWPRF